MAKAEVKNLENVILAIFKMATFETFKNLHEILWLIALF
jgi:hypothetical protein